MRVLRVMLVLFVCGLLSACATKFKTYDGPEVTRILVYKESRRMYLMHNDAVLKAYAVDLGFDPLGDKKVEGDGKTPEGDYFIDRRNPDSDFHLSLGISYPAPGDIAEARELGAGPGGDIFIHGGPRPGVDRTGPDWTAGCISIPNELMEDVYAMVRIGTPISIYP